MVRKVYIQGPAGCLIHEQFEKTDVPVIGGTIFFQIFHMDRAKLSSRTNLVLVDHDQRRPIYRSRFDDGEKMFNWIRKNSYLFIAARITYSDDKAVNQIWISESQMKLHMFESWLCHVLKIPVARWCTAKIKVVDKNYAYVEVYGEWSESDFNSILTNKKKIEDCIQINYNKPPDDDTIPKWNLKDLSTDPAKYQQFLMQQDILKYGKMGGKA